ncbi:MAG: hypothetical protein JJU31_14315 [Wenzhouxiangella sp.]|nr:hypothetical protein [Wenzhouxiangella sp.]TVR91982.1 MAG: hypothetical protein EA418_13675 [Wenzhouxiangellaceae bacterium]
MFRRSRVVCALIFAWLLSGLPLVQAGIDLGGGSIALGGGSLDMGCTQLSVGAAGSLLAEQGSIVNLGGLSSAGVVQAGLARFELSGQWNNQGSFLPGQSSVLVTDACNAATLISGNNSFWNLSIVDIAGPVSFSAGSLQRVANALVLRGRDANSLLSIRSSVPGQAAFLELETSGSQDIFHVSVRDNHAPAEGQALAVGDPADFQSVDAGGNSRWFRDSLPRPIPVNSLTPLATGMLLVLVFMLGLWRRPFPDLAAAQSYRRNKP